MNLKILAKKYLKTSINFKIKSIIEFKLIKNLV